MKSSKWPGFRDHLSYVTTFVTSLEWSLKTGLTVREIETYPKLTPFLTGKRSVVILKVKLGFKMKNEKGIGEK